MTLPNQQMFSTNTNNTLIFEQYFFKAQPKSSMTQFSTDTSRIMCYACILTNSGLDYARSYKLTHLSYPAAVILWIVVSHGTSLYNKTLYCFYYSEIPV